MDEIMIDVRIYQIIWLHFVGDFILQTNNMAIRKSKSFLWLTFHVSVYAIPLLVFGLTYALINLAAHWATDAISSRVTSYLWAKNDRHNFFVVIGIDQAIHLTTLIYTLKFVGNL
jgi:hypothetical protein